MRVFVVGGAGYVGSACFRWLLSHGHDALAFDDLSEGNAGAVPRDRLVVGSILKPEDLKSAMFRYRPDAVMHFAAAASVPESIKDPEFYYRLNVGGTRNVLETMRMCGVTTMVFSSTAATYGLQPVMPLTEESPQSPVVPYGRTKLAAEWMIRDYCRAYGMGCALFRYFNACGADPDGNFGEARKNETHIIPLVLYVPLGLRPTFRVFGHDLPTRDGSCVRDYIHTDDLAQAHQLAIERVRPGDERIYNLGSGTGVTVLEVLRACERAVGGPIHHEMADPRPGDPAVLIASPARAVRELGWRPRYESIDEIVSTAWRWHRSHPRGYAGDRGGVG
ncbi:MAG: UDP-glucose 4-epimerase GalE [Phycisphaerales bacterium]|nr:UDP-glucose 4-epimerase GalE [Phycisphaerales bacterium]